MLTIHPPELPFQIVHNRYLLSPAIFYHTDQNPYMQILNNNLFDRLVFYYRMKLLFGFFLLYLSKEYFLQPRFPPVLNHIRLLSDIFLAEHLLILLFHLHKILLLQCNNRFLIISGLLLVLLKEPNIPHCLFSLPVL